MARLLFCAFLAWAFAHVANAECDDAQLSTWLRIDPPPHHELAARTVRALGWSQLGLLPCNGVYEFASVQVLGGLLLKQVQAERLQDRVQDATSSGDAETRHGLQTRLELLKAAITADIIIPFYVGKSTQADCAGLPERYSSHMNGPAPKFQDAVAQSDCLFYRARPCAHRCETTDAYQKEGTLLSEGRLAKLYAGNTSPSWDPAVCGAGDCACAAAGAGFSAKQVVGPSCEGPKDAAHKNKIREAISTIVALTDDALALLAAAADGPLSPAAGLQRTRSDSPRRLHQDDFNSLLEASSARARGNDRDDLQIGPIAKFLKDRREWDEKHFFPKLEEIARVSSNFRTAKKPLSDKELEQYIGARFSAAADVTPALPSSSLLRKQQSAGVKPAAQHAPRSGHSHAPSLIHKAQRHHSFQPMLPASLTPKPAAAAAL